MNNYFFVFQTFLTAVLSCYIFTSAYKYFANYDTKFKILDYSIICIAAFLMTLNNLYSQMALKISFSLIIVIFLLLVIFRDRILKVIYLSLYLSIISFVIEFVESIILSLIVSNAFALNENLLLKTLFTIVVCISMFYFYRIPLISKIYLKFEDIFSKSKTSIILITFTFIIISFVYVIYTLDYRNFSVYEFGLLIIILISAIEFFYIKQMYEIQILEFKNKYLRDNQDLYKNSLDNYRELRHNLLNDFIFIKTLCQPDVQDVIDEKMSKYSLDVDNLHDLNSIPQGLQGIVYVKSEQAKRAKIDFHIDSTTNIDYKKINYKLYIDLCEMLGITLDNAIEAAKEALDKVIYLNMHESKHSVKIEIINTFSNSIDLDEIGDKNYSTKNRNSGLGLNYIQKLNKDITIKKEIIHNLFKIIISLKK